MKEILFLTLDDSNPGFALTGVRQRVLPGKQVWPALEAACADLSVGVLAVDARLLDGLDPNRLRDLTEHWSGVLVTLPAPAGAPTAPEDELQRLVQRALGYHVRLKT